MMRGGVVPLTAGLVEARANKNQRVSSAACLLWWARTRKKKGKVQEDKKQKKFTYPFLNFFRPDTNANAEGDQEAGDDDEGKEHQNTWAQLSRFKTARPIHI